MQDLSQFDPTAFDRGASRFKEALWVLLRCIFFTPAFPWPSCLRAALLRGFGAKVGQGVVLRSRVTIWFPWRLTLGDYVWLGEEVFILNLASVAIESNVCVSQRAFLCTGSHDYTSSAFDLITKPIGVERGAWIGANAFVSPDVTVGTHAVLTAGSVATKDLQPYGIYQGNPAVLIKKREFGNAEKLTGANAEKLKS